MLQGSEGGEELEDERGKGNGRKGRGGRRREVEWEKMEKLAGVVAALLQVHARCGVVGAVDDVFRRV